MNYKLIAIDMDGTLLGSNHQISLRNREVIKQASEKGVHIVISTGRIFTSARFYAKLLGIYTPIIACNGAFVSEYHRDNVLVENPMNIEDCKEVALLADENNIYYHLYDNINFYVKRLAHSAKRYAEWNQEQKPEDRINFEIFDSFEELAREKKPKIYKIVMVDENPKKLAQFRNIIEKNKNIEIISSWSDNIEIMNKGVSKGKALEQLCEQMKISSQEVIAIGDNYNDISMLEFAGTSVAMGNAEERVKEIASFTTDTNDNDGVAKAIEKLVLK